MLRYGCHVLNSFFNRGSLHKICIVAGALWLGVAIGCQQRSSTTDDAGHSRMKVVGILYGMYMSEHGGKAPPNASEFRAFIEREPANWNKLAPTVDELLSSPRDRSPLKLLYGDAVKAAASGSLPWIAYESTPIDGQRMIVDCRGTVELIADGALGEYVSIPSE